MKAIITKYALSSGVTVAEGKHDPQPTVDGSREMFVSHGQGMFDNYYHGNDFQLTKADAKARVEEMATKLRASLNKRLARIDKAKAKALKQIEEAEV